MSYEDDIITSIQERFEEDARNTDKLRRANKVVELITPIMKTIPLTQKEIDQVYQIARDHGFSEMREVFDIRKNIRFL